MCASKGIATLKLKGYSEGISHSSAVDDCLEIIHCGLLRVGSIQCVKLQNGIGGVFEICTFPFVITLIMFEKQQKKLENLLVFGHFHTEQVTCMVLFS